MCNFLNMHTQRVTSTNTPSFRTRGAIFHQLAHLNVSTIRSLLEDGLPPRHHFFDRWHSSVSFCCGVVARLCPICKTHLRTLANNSGAFSASRHIEAVVPHVNAHVDGGIVQLDRGEMQVHPAGVLEDADVVRVRLAISFRRNILDVHRETRFEVRDRVDVHGVVGVFGMAVEVALVASENAEVVVHFIVRGPIVVVEAASVSSIV
mmetsp:Transcript_15704/g.18910  ORF Transcript_15704/g.18910 Transcript_15704/m.18910 type:complete len:206 (-) Transcript_15704:671-1288(-)